ncbi:hypothetical protein PanWU01x14_343010, partial [Parasponia andersonii]
SAAAYLARKCCGGSYLRRALTSPTMHERPLSPIRPASSPSYNARRQASQCEGALAVQLVLGSTGNKGDEEHDGDLTNIWGISATWQILGDGLTL